MAHQIKKEVKNYLIKKDIDFEIKGQDLYITNDEYNEQTEKFQHEIVSQECPYVVLIDAHATEIYARFHIPTSKEVKDYEELGYMNEPTMDYTSKQY